MACRWLEGALHICGGLAVAADARSHRVGHEEASPNSPECPAAGKPGRGMVRPGASGNAAVDH